MCSRNESGATYCSEVEELLKAHCNVPNKSYEKAPLRRSQRLCEKLKKKSLELTSSNKDIVRSEKVTKIDKLMNSHVCKHNQDIFNMLDLREGKEMQGAKSISQHYITSNEIVCCAGKVVKHIADGSGVPLDLSKKSKAFTGKTPIVALNVATAAMEFENSNNRNIPHVAKNYHKERAKLSLRKKKLILGNKSKWQRKSSSMPYNMELHVISAKSSSNTGLRKEPLKNLSPMDDINYMMNISSDTQNRYEIVQPKIVKLSNGFINNSTESENLRNVYGEKFLHSKKSVRPKKLSITNCAKVVTVPHIKSSGNKISKKKTCGTSNIIENINGTASNSLDNTKSYKTTSKKRSKRSCKIDDKCFQAGYLSKENTINSSEDKYLPKIFQDKLLYGTKTKRTRKSSSKVDTQEVPDPYEISFCNEISEKKPTKSPAFVECIKYLEDISSDKEKFNKSLQHIKKNSTTISNKGTQLINTHLNTNKLVKQTKSNVAKAKKNSSILDAKCAKSAELNVLNTESAIIQNQTLHKIDQIQRITTRSQKKKCQSDENISKLQSNELLHIHHNIKSEPFTLLEMNKKICDETNETETVTNNMQNNSLQLKNEIFASKQAINTKSSSELKPNTVLRNAAFKINKKLSGKNATSIECKSLKLKNDCKKIKTEIFSQKASEEKMQINTSQKIKRISGQQINEYEFNTNELKNVNQHTASHMKSANEATVICKTQKAVNNIKKIKQANNASSQPKTEIDLKNSTLNKNYLKSFDRSQFLAKIENAQNYINAMSVQKNNYSKLNTFEIPPTPAESSQDLLKKPILPDVYPPYFENQLPPEAVFTQSLVLQPHPTNVITPDDTASLELLNSSSSSPSLPESLCKLFQNKDVKNILNVERTSYRLYSYHIQALALILNLRLEYLIKVLEKIINISPNVLKNIDKAVKMPFVPDNDIFSNSSAELWPSSGVVLNSQSPKQQRLSKTNNKIVF